MRQAFAALLFPLFLVSCASLAARGLLPDVRARRPPPVQLGGELILFHEAPLAAASLIAGDGRVHLFIADERRELRHIEIVNEKVVASALLGAIEKNQQPAIDAVEHPVGKLRVAAGDKQYVRDSPGGGWREIKGNRCARFIKARDQLLCAFVIAGDEIGAPARKDWTVGWFILVPVAFWSNTQAAKLVVALESNDQWVLRAVVDPETDLDALRDFMVDADSEGNLHFLYSVSRGGGLFAVAVGPAPGAAAAGFQGPLPELRYARASLAPLVAAPPALSEPQANSTTLKPWQSISSALVRETGVLSRLNRRFAFNRAAGEASGLIWGNVKMNLAGNNRQFQFSGDAMDCCMWMERAIRDGAWLARLEVVAATDLPDDSYEWLRDDSALLKGDAKGNLHALLEHSQLGFWTASFFIAYLVKSGDRWSAPVTLGSSATGTARTLAVNGSGFSFAGWVDKDGKFIGRWIRPRESRASSG